MDHNYSMYQCNNTIIQECINERMQQCRNGLMIGVESYFACEDVLKIENKMRMTSSHMDNIGSAFSRVIYPVSKSNLTQKLVSRASLYAIFMR